MICAKRCLGGREAWKRRCDVAPLPQTSRLIFGPGGNGLLKFERRETTFTFPSTNMDFMCHNIAQSTALYATMRREPFQQCLSVLPRSPS
jgi:hypothetical protein